MLNKIIKISLNSRLTVLILTGVVMFVGVLALLQTDVDIFPDLNAPTVVVMTEASGLAPEEVERLVTYPIETAVNGASGVRRVRSSSTTGFSVVWVEFDWDADPLEARQIVSERLSGLEMSPAVGTPTLGPQSSILGEMMIVGLTGGENTSLLDLRDIADRQIAPRLLSLSGVSQVSVIGGDAKQYQIRLSSERMRHHGVTLNDVLSATEGINDNVGGGVLYEYGNEYIVKGDVSTSRVEDISLCVVKAGDDGIVTVGDIADVGVGPEQPRLGAASVKGAPSVLITVSKQPKASTIDLTKDIDAMLADMSPQLPADVTVSTDIFRQSEFIETSVSNLQRSLFEGALFVIVVLFVFLMNVRTTVISVVALPLSIIVTMLVLNALGMTINTMSLGGIAIAIGSLVDDAIVDVENVYKRLREWWSARRDCPDGAHPALMDVVYQASAEVRMPIFNSSLIIIASFVPLFFLSGMEGRMLKPLGIAFIVALVASTIVALTVTPVLCSLLLGTRGAMRKLDKQTWATRHLRQWYGHALSWSMGHRRVILSLTGVAAIAAVVLLLTLGRGFLPPFNEGSFTINVSTLPGISLEESDRVGRVAEELILSVPEVTTVARKTGRSELDEHSLGVNVSEIEAPYQLSGRTRGQVVKELREKLSTIPGANIEIGQPISHRIDAMLSGTEAQIAVKVFGNDLNQLYAIGNSVRQSMSEVPGVVDVNIEQQIERPQLDIRPRREMLAAYGVTMPEFRQMVSALVGGATVSKVYEGAYPYDLTVVFDPGNRETAAALADVSIDTPKGPVPLSAVADIVSATGPNTINRENAKRRLVISANVQDRDLRSAVNDIKQQVNQEVDIPEGVYITYGGQFESEESATRTLLWATLGALVVIFMLLYQEFRTVSESLIVMVNMPLAMIGGVLALVITGQHLNIPAVIGFIALLGISTRNGMLLISRYKHLIAEGHGVDEAVAIGSSDRLLPIIMTALTSALALIPIAVKGSEPGNEIQSPLAIVILGGLVTSTFLNIFVVPLLYKKFCHR